jgi:hypothetical protein
MSKTTIGKVTIKLAEKDYTLVPNLAAVRDIEQRFGGLRGAVVACQELSVGGMAGIICAGTGETDHDAMAELVWQEGASVISAQLAPFVVALLNPRGEAGKKKAETQEAQ